MTKESARLIIDNSVRCTEATLKAFGVEGIPSFGSGVLEHLRANGFRTLRLPMPATSLSMARFKNRTETEHGRINNYLIFTLGHAMAVINGVLIDTAKRGWDSRKIEQVFVVLKEEAINVPSSNSL